MAYLQYKNKNLYFQEIGEGHPLLLLHGNTASSKMFDGVVDLYRDHFKLILPDFLGHGKSDRLGSFPADLWYDEALQVIHLLGQNNFGRVNIIGTSGGALVAMNIALERGNLVNKVMADSFEGEQSLDGFGEVIFAEREQAKSLKEGRAFWKYCHGDDWESIVDNDTDAVIRHGKSIKKFFHKDLSQLDVPVMFTASLEDEFAEIAGLDFHKVYGDMLGKIPNGRLYLFQTGGHPAMISNAAEFFGVAKNFFLG